MNKRNLILLILTVVAGVFFVFAWSRPNAELSPVAADNGSANSATTTSSRFEPKTSSDGWAEIEVVPLSLGSSEWSFKVVLDAHQELDADLAKAATLLGDRGDILTPLRWENPDPSAHHQEGTLVFSAPASKPQTLTLTIKGIGGAAMRTFTWQLPQKVN